MLEGNQLTERICRGDNLQLAGEERARHLEHIHCHRFAGRSLVPVAAVGDDQGDIALAGAAGAQGVTVHRGVAVRHFGEVGDAVGRGQGWIRDELSRHPSTLVEGFHGRCQAIHGGVPVGFLVGRGDRAESFHGGEIAAAEHIQQKVFLSEDLVLVFTPEYQGALRSPIWVEEEPLRQMGWQVGEVSLALVGIGLHAIG